MALMVATMRETFWEEIVQEARGEPIEAVVIGEMGWPDYGEEGKEVARAKKGVILTAVEAEPLLSYSATHGFGALDCHAVYVWTTERVIFVSQYDGATSLVSVPRNPTPTLPYMPGGG